MIQHILLVYTDTTRASDGAGDLARGHFDYRMALAHHGAFVASAALYDAVTAMTVEPGGAVTDGPVVDTTWQLIAFYILDVDTMAEALEWAAREPGLRLGLDRVEVRSVMMLPPRSAPPAT